MFSIYCIFAFGVVFPLLAKDFPEAEYLAGGIQGKGLRHLRPRDLISGGNITSLGHSKHSKRSAEVTGLTCTSLSGIESTIKNNTHTVSVSTSVCSHIEVYLIAKAKNCGIRHVSVCACACGCARHPSCVCVRVFKKR
jgi:hypothetical protein